MENSEEFYRKLCSLETVRSEKKGFFRDFSECVARVAGDTWISSVFGRLADDEARIRTVFTDDKIKDTVLETLNRTKILYRTKDAEASRARRLEAFEAAAAGEREKALVLFGQAVLRAPTSLSAELPRVSCGEHPSMPAASALLDVEETTTAGKRAIASKEIDPGATLVVEPPLASCLLPEFFGTHCHHCFSRLRRPIGCSNCSSVAFCSRTCRDEAVTSYHKYECKILVLLIGSGMSALSTLALRMVTQSGSRECASIGRALNRRNGEDDHRKTEDEPETKSTTKPSRSAKRRIRKKMLRDSKYQREKPDTENGAVTENVSMDEKKEQESVDLRAYGLEMHANRRTAEDFFERSLMAAFLLKCLQRVEFFENPTADNEAPTQLEIQVGALLLKHLQLLQFNAHEVFETRVGTEHRFRGSRPVYIGVAIYPTVARFNHDCYPAVTRYFVGRSIVIRATRSFRVGDTIAENYGPIFTKRSLEERQRTLAGRYWFRCECTACRENWPRFDTALTNDDARLRCPTQGCRKLHRRPRDTGKSIECSACRRTIDLRGSLASLRECEDLYGQGFAAMDQEQLERALEAFLEAAKIFHRIAVPPHKDTHLAEIAASACMADAGNVRRQTPLLSSESKPDDSHVRQRNAIHF
ncbi:PREDICTED: SET and MYND domain-containing protein 4-like [Dufourea novaeangliae]|uniref:SET and MYND domain-containing protein 4-like n=1 Tax=Dufourea novaeangliae TaxID=178035 RepID=UPI0007678C7E|nr:PREDICTED: SET and MYND domain-containing protein 4-like [Dufourea novaeangliae]